MLTQPGVFLRQFFCGKSAVSGGGGTCRFKVKSLLCPVRYRPENIKAKGISCERTGEKDGYGRGNDHHSAEMPSSVRPLRSTVPGVAAFIIKGKLGSAGQVILLK